MRKTDFRFTDKKRLSLADIVLAAGPMEERKALGIAKALCSRLIDETGLSESDLTAFNPNTILLSSKGTISFSGDTVSETVKEPYLPPEYVKGSTSKETVLIYGLGMLLLFLVTGQEKKTGASARIKNQTLKTVIDRCTAIDSRRRFQSLAEVRAAVNREIFFPRKRMRILALLLVLCLTAAAAFYLFLNGRSFGEAEGKTVGFQDGYRNGYETAVSEAPGIGIEDTAFPDAYGNLSGNLNSPDGAFAVPGGDSIFIAYDGGAYRMDPYSKETLLLSEHGELSCLNYWQGYLYYLTEDALVRLDPGTGQEETVSDRLWGRFCIYDGKLYVDDERTTGFLYSIDTSSLEVKQLNSQKSHNSLNVGDGTLFYADPEKGDQLFRSDHDGGNTSRLLSRVCSDIDLSSGRIYCLTADAVTGGDPETLVSMNSAGGEVDVLTNQPVSRFVAEQSGVFYISASTGYLEWMTPDGKTVFTVCAREVSDFNVAGRWIFCRIVGDDALYRMRIDGSDYEKLP